MANPMARVMAMFKRVDGGTSLGYFGTSGSEQMQMTRVSRAGALMSNAFMTAEQAKARSKGSLPARVYKDGKDGGRETVPGHALNKLVARQWNPLVTAQDGWQWQSIYTDTYGTAYVRVEWRGPNPVAFWPLNCSVIPLYDREASVSPARYDVAGDKFTEKGVYLDREILAFKTPISTDGGITGRSLADLAASEIGLSIDLTRFYANIIGKGFSAGGILESEKEVTVEDAKAIGEKNRALSGPDHAGELRLFDRGLKFKEIGQSMAEANIIDQQTFILQSVARACYVQPAKVMDYSRATFSNIEESNIAWVTDTIAPEITSIESVLNGLLEHMGQSDYYVKFDLAGLLRGSFTSQMEGFRTQVYAGIRTRAEIRKLLDLPFIEGTDEILQPSAYFTIDPATGEAKPAPAPPKKLPEKTDPLATVLADARERVDKRVQRDGPTEKTQDFARTVMAPVGDAYERLGIEFDLEKEIPHA